MAQTTPELQAQLRGEQADIQRQLDTQGAEAGADHVSRTAGLEDWPAVQRAMAGAIERRADIRAEDICAALDAGSGLGRDQDIRHLAGQVKRQFDLPRHAQRDQRFLTHLEWALRDLAVRR